MKRYAYLRFWIARGHLTLESSSPEELQRFSVAFETQLTSLTLKGGRYFLHPDAHEPIDFTRHYGDLKEYSATMYWWALRILCESGWEPVTVAYQTSSEGRVSENSLALYPQIHLRKELE